MEEPMNNNRLSKLSEKQTSFKIKSKTSNKQSQINYLSLDSASIANLYHSKPTDLQPVYEKNFIADAKGMLKSFYQFSNQEEISYSRVYRYTCRRITNYGRTDENSSK